MATDDFITEERKWQREQQARDDQERDRRRRAWTERTQYIATAVAFIAIVAIIAGVWWRVQTTMTENTTDQVNTCTEHGGTWTRVGGGTKEMCVRMTVEVPR